MIDVFLTCTVFGVFILLSFKEGYKLGSKEEEKPVEEVKERKPKKDEVNLSKEEINFYKAISNLENYDGTAESQEEIK